MSALNHGKVVLKKAVVIDCLIRELSVDNARLEFWKSVDLPATFKLLVVGSGVTFAVELVWSTGIAAGIRIKNPNRN